MHECESFKRRSLKHVYTQLHSLFIGSGHLNAKGSVNVAIEIFVDLQIVKGFFLIRYQIVLLSNHQ